MLEGLKPPVKHHKTMIEVIAEQLEEKDKKIFYDALNDPEWSGAALSKALKDRGIQLSPSAIHRYRSARR